MDGSGTIITNLHLIGDARSVSVTMATGDVYDSIRVRAFDHRRDLAVIQISGYRLPTVELGDSGSLAPGDPVVVIGNPLGVLTGSVSAGIVSAVRLLETGFRVIQTDAAASVGSSGGPMLNAQGEVVGVLAFKWRGAENVNFVIPINYARPLLATTESYSLDELPRRLAAASGDPPESRTSATAAPPTPPPAPVRVGDGGIQAPVKVKDVKPHYPRTAVDAGIQGIVILEAVIDVDGIPKQLRVLRSLDAVHGLDQAAIQAVEQWRFTPTKVKGVPVPVIMTVTVTFSLK